MQSNLAQIRLLEAVSFRSFPATKTRYDGTWAIRLTAGLPAKRLNSVNPLDPNDSLDLEGRINLAERRFESFGRPLVFRLTPLAPKGLAHLFSQLGWQEFDESIVMQLDLTRYDLEGICDQLPIQDVGRWVTSFLALSGDKPELKPGLVEVISATEPETGLFVSASKGDDDFAGLVRCVSDRRWAGVFDLVTSKEHLRQGHARSILKTALLWAKRNGAQNAWLQVVAANEPANNLYKSLGFEEVYRYRYWKPPV